MASIKLKFRASSLQGKKGTIYYQVIHDRVVRQIKTDYKLFDSEWSSSESSLVVPAVADSRRDTVRAYQEQINIDFCRLARIVSNYERTKLRYSCDELVVAFESQGYGNTLCDFMQMLIERLVELRKYRTSETYRTTLNSFMRFHNGVDVLLVDMSSDLMMDYEAYLKYNNISMNSISFYMRILRAVYNRAVDKELVVQSYPFKHVYTGVDKTLKRALPLKSIKKIKELDLSSSPDLAFARDLFMFSFYTRGMSFVDIAYLRKKDLSHNVLTYRRRKTGQQLYIKWEPCMQQILDKYAVEDTIYLLPIICRADRGDRAQYRNTLCRVNGRLKDIAKMVGIVVPLTMYVARHSWASIAKSSNVPISVISEGMGHDSETTTQIYLSSLDTAVVDRANNKILRLL